MSSSGEGDRVADLPNQVPLLDASKLAMEKPSTALTTCLERTSTVYLSTMILLRILWAQWQKNGINGTIFTYGQTSSGKAFKMQGNGHNDIGGIIQFAATDIFERIKQSWESSSESTVKVSYVEIYNEELWDLLTDNKRKTTLLSLNIREDKCSSITVQNLKEVAVRNLDRLHCKRGISKTVSDKLSLANNLYVGLVLSLLSRKFAKKYYC